MFIITHTAPNSSKIRRTTAGTSWVEATQLASYFRKLGHKVDVFRAV